MENLSKQEIMAKDPKSVVGTEICRKLRDNFVRMSRLSEASSVEDKQELLGIHSQNIALLTHLRSVNRALHFQANDCRLELEKSRESVDQSAILYQNMDYEANYLQQQIDICEGFQLSYPQVELLPELVYLEEHPEIQPGDYDHHTLLIKRYEDELERRKILEEKSTALKQSMDEKTNIRNTANTRMKELDTQMNILYQASLPVKAFIQTETEQPSA